MPQNITEQRLQDFLNVVSEWGGSAGNKSLREKLEWDEEFYWRVQGRLIELGKIEPGRGRGGSVKLTEAALKEIPEARAEQTPIREETISAKATERALYKPLKDTIQTKWIERFGFDDFKVDETHSRGSKDTGGTYTRPDITAVGIRRYIYLPKTLEIITFEVKSSDYVNVLGVLEAIAHREASNRSYVIYSVSKQDFDDAPEAERIMVLAQKYGIGILLVASSENVDEWELLIDAIRHEPDPTRLDRFLGDLPSEQMKKQLAKWKE
jgi:hypothetical protein